MPFKILIPFSGIVKGTFLSQQKQIIFRNKYIFNNIVNYRKFSSKDTSLIRGSSPDLLLQNLKSSYTTESVLEIVGLHNKIMNNQHIMQALRSLFTLQKSGNTNLTTKDIISHPNFYELCKNLKTQSRKIELNEAIEALKVMSYVGVPSDSTISQVLLQLVRHQINQLSLHHIIFLDFLLRQWKRGPLTEALIIALPIVFDINLKLKMDRENVVHLSDLLHFASKTEISDESVDEIVRALIKHGTNMNYKTAKSILWSLCDLPPNQKYTELLTNTCHVLSKHINVLSIVDIETTLSKLVKKYSKKAPFYYNENFTDSCVDCLIKNNVDFETALWTLKRLMKIGHTSVSLMNYILKHCIQTPVILSEIKPILAFVLIHGIANTGPTTLTEWRSVTNMVINSDVLKSGSMELPWLQLAVELASLDIFSLDILKKAFNRTNIQRILQKDYNYHDFFQLLLLNQTVLVKCPEYEEVLPAKDVIETVLNKMGQINDEFPLKGALEKGFGGASYVKTNVKSNLGYNIDHIIVMRKGGYPIAINLHDEENILLDDLVNQYSNDEHICIIFGLQSNAYSLNCQRMRATISLMIKILEMQGMSVIPISVMQWFQLSDHEKIPYLMQTIRIKINEKENAANVISN